MLSASFCGVFGFRPTRGIISRRGAHSTSPTLDQVGMFGRDLEDVAFLADVLGGYDAADEASGLRPRPRMREGFRSKPPVEPDFICLDMPYDERLSTTAEEGFEELRNSLGEHVVRLPAPGVVRPAAGGAPDHRRVRNRDLVPRARRAIELFVFGDRGTRLRAWRGALSDGAVGDEADAGILLGILSRLRCGRRTGGRG